MNHKSQRVQESDTSFVVVKGKKIFVDTDLRLNLKRLGIQDPNEIEGFEALQDVVMLYLEDNDLERLPDLSNLTNLAYLYAARNKLNDISGLAHTTSLVSVDLSSNRLVTFQDLKMNLSLDGLKGDKNQLTELKSIESFPNLHFLSLNSNCINSINGIECCTELEELYLNNNKLRRVDKLAPLSKLKIIELANNELESIDGIPWTSATNIDVSGNKVTSITLTKGILNLDLSSNDIENVVIEPDSEGDPLVFDIIDLDDNNIRDTSWLKHLMGTLKITMNPLHKGKIPVEDYPPSLHGRLKIE